MSVNIDSSVDLKELHLLFEYFAISHLSAATHTEPCSF